MNTTMLAVLLFTTPLYQVGEVVLVTNGERIDCLGHVTDVTQPPGEDIYDVDLFFCPDRYLKGTIPVTLPESWIHGYGR